MIAFNDRKNQTHELSLSVHDSGPGWNVWLATVGDDTRYFEADDGVEVWDLIDMAAHCYDEPEETVGEDYWDTMRQEVAADYTQYQHSLNRHRSEMFDDYTRLGQGLPQTYEGADLKRLSEIEDFPEQDVFVNEAINADFNATVQKLKRKEAIDRIASAPKIEYPALYRKLLSPEEFTD